jgi:hypothetical protein
MEVQNCAVQILKVSFHQLPPWVSHPNEDFGSVKRVLASNLLIKECCTSQSKNRFVKIIFLIEEIDGVASFFYLLICWMFQFQSYFLGVSREAQLMKT